MENSKTGLQKYKMDYCIKRAKDNIDNIFEKYYFEDKTILMEASNKQEAIEKLFGKYNFPIIIAKVIEV